MEHRVLSPSIPSMRSLARSASHSSLPAKTLSLVPGCSSPIDHPDGNTGGDRHALGPSRHRPHIDYSRGAPASRFHKPDRLPGVGPTSPQPPPHHQLHIMPIEEVGE